LAVDWASSSLFFFFNAAGLDLQRGIAIPILPKENGSGR
jgi:hypothetical protein